jgi:hypothetical protein
MKADPAHGGLDRWRQVTSIRVPASITGAIWFVKGKGDVLKDVVLTVETRRERLAVAYVGQNKRALFEPSRVVVETKDGEPIVARDNPEKSFEGQLRETPWDDGHVAYFVGEALWTYLNTPWATSRSPRNYRVGSRGAFAARFQNGRSWRFGRAPSSTEIRPFGLVRRTRRSEGPSGESSTRIVRARTSMSESIPAGG